MSDHNTTVRDTRPDWMLDPSIAEIDDDAIAAVGKIVEETNQQNADAASAFIARGREDGLGQGSGVPSTDEPSAGGALPGSDPTTEPGAAPTNEPPATGAPASGAPATDLASETPPTFKVNIPGAAPVDLDEGQVLQLIQQYQWVRNQPQEVLQAWGGIESGTHQAIPSTEYAAFQAWKQTGGLSQPVGQAPVQQRNQRPVDLRDVDPDVAEYIQRLEQQQAPAQQAPVQPVQQAPVQPQQSALDSFASRQAEIDRQVRLIAARDTVRAEYMQQYGFDEAQMVQFETAVKDAQVIPAISQRHVVMNPLGTGVLQEGDPQVIFREAFDAVMAIHPTYKAIRDEAIYNRRLAQDAERNRGVNTKKAAAGSLAHIPSAAVSAQGNSGKSIEQMTPQERQSAMAAEIAQLIASGEIAN